MISRLAFSFPHSPWLWLACDMMESHLGRYGQGQDPGDSRAMRSKKLGTLLDFVEQSREE